jgi:hypothetical protein
MFVIISHLFCFAFCFLNASQLAADVFIDFVDNLNPAAGYSFHERSENPIAMDLPYHWLVGFLSSIWPNKIP